MEETARDAVCYSCTQVGKTAACAVWLMARRWNDPGHLGGWYAPTEKQLRQGFSEFVQITSTAGILARKTESPGNRMAWLTNGSSVNFASWDHPDSLRGETIYDAVVDEAGLLTQQAHGIISSRRSATLGPIRWIGNPGLVTGPFRSLCAHGEDPERNRKLISTYRWTWRDHARTLECPCGSPDIEATTPADPSGHGGTCGRRDYLEFIANEKTTLPEVEYLRLYEAEWTADEDALFRSASVDDKTTGEPWSKPEPGVNYIAGVDVGQMNDYLVVALFNQETRRLGYMERWRGLPSHESEEKCTALSERWNGATLVVETNGPGRPLFDGLQKRGVFSEEWVTTAQSKGPAILAFARELHDPVSGLTLAPLPPLQAELKVYRYIRLPAGGYRYTAPAGMHDDCVIAAVVGHQAISSVAAGIVRMPQTAARYGGSRRGGAFASRTL